MKAKFVSDNLNVLLGGVLGNDEDVVHHVQQKGGIRLDFAHGLAGLGC